MICATRSRFRRLMSRWLTCIGGIACPKKHVRFAPAMSHCGGNGNPGFLKTLWPSGNSELLAAGKVGELPVPSESTYGGRRPPVPSERAGNVTDSMRREHCQRRAEAPYVEFQFLKMSETIGSWTDNTGS